MIYFLGNILGLNWSVWIWMSWDLHRILGVPLFDSHERSQLHQLQGAGGIYSVRKRIGATQWHWKVRNEDLVKASTFELLPGPSVFQILQYIQESVPMWHESHIVHWTSIEPAHCWNLLLNSRKALACLIHTGKQPSRQTGKHAMLGHRTLAERHHESQRLIPGTGSGFAIHALEFPGAHWKADFQT